MTGNVPPPSARQRSIPVLESYRGLAAMMVLTTHVAFVSGAITWPVVGPVLGRLDFGVPLFFLLSGFLLASPWLRADLADGREPSVRVYLRRRFARIYPAYWVMLAATLLVLPANQDADAVDWLQYALLVQEYGGTDVSTGLTHLWSLSVEVAFYLALPAIMVAAARVPSGRDITRVRRVHQLVLVALLLIGVGSRLLALGPFVGTAAGLWLPAYLDWFALGMLAAFARVSLDPGARDRQHPPRWTLGLRALAGDGLTSIAFGVLLFALACTPLAGPLTLDTPTVWEGIIKHVLYGGAAFFLLLPGFLGPDRGPVQRALDVPVLRRLGLISYGVFLWHLMLLELLRPAMGIEQFSGGFWLLWPTTVLATLVVAQVSWVTLEAPAQRWSHRPRLRQGARAATDQASKAAVDTST